MPVIMQDPTREIAFDLLCAVLERHRSLEEALDAAGAAGGGRDRAAGHRLAAGVLRRLGSLHAVLEPFLQRAPPDAVRIILRLGAAGLLLLGTPPHAAVGTAVALARTRKLTPFAGLVNAVLRRVAEAGPGGFVFVPPWVPHQEINALDDEPLECVLTRSGQEPVVVNLDIEGVADPEHVPWVDPAHPA